MFPIKIFLVIYDYVLSPQTIFFYCFAWTPDLVPFPWFRDEMTMVIDDALLSRGSSHLGCQYTCRHITTNRSWSKWKQRQIIHIYDSVQYCENTKCVSNGVTAVLYQAIGIRSGSMTSMPVHTRYTQYYAFCVLVAKGIRTMAVMILDIDLVTPK